jgi:hypothetical protein
MWAESALIIGAACVVLAPMVDLYSSSIAWKVGLFGSALCLLAALGFSFRIDAAPSAPESFGCTSAPLAMGESNWIGVPARYRLYASQPGIAAATPDGWQPIPVWTGELSGPTQAGTSQGVQVRSTAPNGSAVVCPVWQAFMPLV